MIFYALFDSLQNHQLQSHFTNGLDNANNVMCQQLHATCQLVSSSSRKRGEKLGIQGSPDFYKDKMPECCLIQV